MPANSSSIKRGKHSFSAFFVFFSLFILLAAAGTASAVSVQVSDFKYSDSADIAARYYQAKITVTCSGQQNEAGIIEMGLSKESNTLFASIWSFSPEKPCESTFPWNTHASYECRRDVINPTPQSSTLTFTGRGIPDGTFYPAITHATACFRSGGEIKEPYGWGKRITSYGITFGNPGGNAADQCDTPYQALQYVKKAGDVACAEAICYNPETTRSEAKCVRRSECAEGAEQWTTCSMGSSVAVRRCSSGQWSETGNKCPEKVLPPTPPPTVPTPPPDKKFDFMKIGLITIIVFGAWFFGRPLLAKVGVKF